MNVRDNWRIVLLSLFSLVSLAVLLGPSVVGGAAGGATGLQYGLELSGGTRVRAPLIGMHAQPVEFPNDTSTTDLRRGVAAELDVSQTDVGIRPRAENGPTVEVYSENVSRTAFREALAANGITGFRGDYTVERGVSRETRQEAVTTLSNKINQGGLTGGTVRTASSADRSFVVVEVPNANRSEVLDLIRNRGQVEVVAHFPTGESGEGNQSYREVSLLTNDDFTNVGPARSPDPRAGIGSPYVQTSLTDAAARNFSNAMVQFGFTRPEAVTYDDGSRGRLACEPDAVENPNENNGYCLYTVVDDEVVFAAPIADGLAQQMENGEFERNPTYITTTGGNLSEARQLSINLRAGALPTELDIEDRGTTYFLQPSLAQEFKLFSLIAGLVAYLAVSIVVFIRYGSPRVAVPMLATAAAEVFLLLGFAATVGLALDLSHIAGFIAVIGTGVDDLIIIADEILQEGKVATGRVFQNRFRKAFWVIGAAAATTVVAMSPLTVLSLGDLTGFAIVTIVGVLLGVFVTRPAYGDILRNLMLGDEAYNRD